MGSAGIARDEIVPFLILSLCPAPSTLLVRSLITWQAWHG